MGNGQGWPGLFIVAVVLCAMHGTIDHGVWATTSACPKRNVCVPRTQCNLDDLRSAFIFPCHSGLNWICCPIEAAKRNVTELENRQSSVFPVNCGTILTSDKITGGEKADLGQFPWMALLGYQQKGVNFTQFFCGGSIISDRFIVTAAHCIELQRYFTPKLARLGELNLQTDIDCVRTGNVEVCADKFVELEIDSAIAHPDYDPRKLYNDIGLIKLRAPIRFSDYIQPICLPFERQLTGRDLTRQKFIVSGWGKTNVAHLGGSSDLQFASIRVWEQQKCINSVPSSVRPLSSAQLCATGDKNQDACKGDSGGPLVNATIDSNGDVRYFQVGVVSFSSAGSCGNTDLPTVYVRIDNYLDWISNNLMS